MKTIFKKIYDAYLDYYIGLDTRSPIVALNAMNTSGSVNL